jgi:asparagine synthase (glutamine-hydrolysing)
MCGIVGIFDPECTLSTQELEEQISRMIRVIKHRGPDDEGIFVDEGIGLGACRLSILDLSPLGNMPMVDAETGNRIVHNGEVYNYREIKSDQGLERIRSNTDTEVILKTYGQLGEKCLDIFNGMFGFCVWDPKKKQLFGARDRIGIKPFFYTFHEEKFYFCSEIKGLLACGIPRRLNPQVAFDYLAYGIYDHSEETFFDGIKQLPPGHYFTINPEGIEITQYWDLGPDLEHDETFLDEKSGFENVLNSFVELIEDSIRLRLRSDVPLGVHVSGGLDSTVMMNVINRINGGQGNIKAFSYYYGESKYDEKAYVEDLIGRTEWEVGFHQLIPEEVPDLAEEAMWAQEQPFPGIITLAKHKLIKDSRSFGATVILEGQGGDEIGGGYQYFLSAHLFDLIQQGKGDQVLGEIELFGKRNDLTLRQAVSLFIGSLSSYYKMGHSADGSSSIKTQCINPDFFEHYNREVDFPKPFESHLLNMQYRDILHTKLPRILRSCDRASMAFSRELRVPILDHRLVEFTFKIPGHFKIRDGEQRYFMRQAMRFFPKTPLVEIPKRAVVDPQREWLKMQLKDWVHEILSSESFGNRHIFDHGQVRREFESYLSQEINPNSFFIWQWISLELWHRTFFDSFA